MKQGRLVLAVAIAAVFCVGFAACGSRADSPHVSTTDAATLEVASFPAADVWIDGTWKGSTPISVSVTPGSHEVTLKQSGFGEHTESVDLAGGGRGSVDAVLIAEDLDDPHVIARLARPFDVAVEPFEAPEQHRGGRKAPSAVLLWPRRDVRAEGLSTFGLEVGEDYEGDGYLMFRQGRNVLYKEAFDPDTMTTVATIPLDVLEAADVGDTVTWGIVFDSRRKKPIEARFKVVNRPKADKRLARMAKDRHLARQPPVARAMVKITGLQNYRLYSEALVGALEILQEDATATQPYQVIVTCLRRVDAKESRLYGIASQYVSGSGRARAGRTGITAFAPQNARPVPLPPPTPGSVASRTENPTGPRTGDGVTPGLRPVPNDGSTPEQPTTPDAPTVDTPTGAADFDPAALAQHAREKEDAATEARSRADDARQEAEQADLAAREAEQAASDAGKALSEADDDIARAEQALESEGDSEENLAALEAAKRARAEADGDAAHAASLAQAAQKASQLAAERAKQEALAANQLEHEAEQLRNDAVARGIDLEHPTGQPADDPKAAGLAMDESQRAFDTAQGAVGEIQGRVQELEMQAAEQPDNAELQQELDTARGHLTEAQAAADQARDAYVAMLGSQGKTPALLSLLESELGAAQQACTETVEAMGQAKAALDDDPENTDLQAAHAAAVAANDRAQKAFDDVVAEYQLAKGDPK